MSNWVFFLESYAQRVGYDQKSYIYYRITIEVCSRKKKEFYI